MKRIAIVALILLAALLVACTTTTTTPPVIPPSTPSTPSVPATPTVPVTAPVLVRVYFAVDANRMQPFLRELPAGTKATLKGALLELLKGPSAEESAAGFASAIPDGTVLRGIKVSGTTAVVDFNSKYESGGGNTSIAIRLDQVIYTATQFPTVKSVLFKIDGKTVKIFSGEGVELDGPQTRKDADYAIPAIFVDNPAWRGTVNKGTIARGTADVFEATFRLQLRDSAGQLLVDKTVHATSGTGTRGSWSLKLTWTKVAQPGIGELKVFDQSEKDGQAIDIVTVPVVIAE